MNNIDNNSRKGRLGRLLMLAAMLMLAGSMQAQVPIMGTHAKFQFPSKWQFLSTQKVDANTTMYLYFYNASTIVSQGDTVLPFLRIYVRTNYTKPVYDFVFERYTKEPYESLNDYSKGLGLPKSGGAGFEGAYTNVKDKKDYRFRMVYFKEKNTIVEFRLETTKATYPQMEKEFEAILKSITF